MSNTKDPRMPGPLLSASSTQLLPSTLFRHPAPSAAAARRIAERVNLAWAHAWADELASAPVGHGMTSQSVQKALAHKSDPELLRRLELAALANRKPEDMERSEWFTPKDDPWEDGVYEVEFLCHRSEPRAAGFARFWKVRPEGSYNHWSSLCVTVDEAAAMIKPGGSLRPHWRGISEAQARALGVL